jgi:hypothetical protein
MADPADRDPEQDLVLSRDGDREFNEFQGGIVAGEARDFF